jgi:hypothetical protein
VSTRIVGSYCRAFLLKDTAAVIACEVANEDYGCPSGYPCFVARECAVPRIVFSKVFSRFSGFSAGID